MTEVLSRPCETPPPKKRRRSSSTVSTRSSPAGTRLMRDKTLYFMDGSVILSAPGDVEDANEVQELGSVAFDKIPPPPNAPNAIEKGAVEDGDQVMEDENSAEKEDALDIIVYFRVHKSLLMGESTVFEEMIERSSNELSKYDGVPVVALNDKAKDVRGFLKAIYKPYTIFLSRYNPRSAVLLSGPLLIAAKYKADALKDRIVAHIKADWPVEDFLEWKQRSEKLPEEDVPDPEELIHLARTTGLTEDLKSALAVAYYVMLSFSPSSLQTELLDVKDCVKLMEARSRIDTWLWAWIQETICNSDNAFAKGPNLGLSCEKCRLTSFRERVLLEWMKFSRDSTDVIEYLESAAQGLNEKSGIEFCSKKCRVEAGKWLKAMAKAFCEKLEEMFMDEKKNRDSPIDEEDREDREGEAADNDAVIMLGS